MEKGKILLPIWMFILITAVFFFAGFNYGKSNALTSEVFFAAFFDASPTF